MQANEEAKRFVNGKSVFMLSRLAGSWSFICFSSNVKKKKKGEILKMLFLGIAFFFFFQGERVP